MHEQEIDRNEPVARESDSRPADSSAAPPPSGAPAKTAAVLAMLVGGIGGFAAIPWLVPGERTEAAGPAGYVLGAVIASIGVLYFTGGVLLFRRKTAGRIIVIGVAALLALASFIAAGFGPAVGQRDALVGGFFQVGILTLAALGATGEWIAAGRSPR
ncbi:hypothetical protein AB0H49_30040 [Nocardia sp. NPDC050713]|uniref:hypothetical protein n=1 Tax=Nocardia sp. NPDC050713 TaxID=3154511 RepID=UPI0033FEAAEA